jgi:ABC-type hemin transport system substrate-binding protein
VKARVISLVPSSTETLLALGADVVACTRFCEQPALVHVGGTKNPDVAAIVGLEPDVVVLDREENRLEDHDALVAAGLEVFVSDVRTIDAALRVVAELADAAGVERQPVGAVPSSDPPLGALAFVPIWRRPWMSISAATYGGSLLRRLGIGLVTADSDVAYPALELDEVAARRPDVVLVPSEPYDFHVAHLDELAAAFPSARIRRIDGQDLFWWGIRTPPALARLAAALG